MLFEVLSEHSGSEQCKPEGIQIHAIVYNISDVSIDIVDALLIQLSVQVCAFVGFHNVQVFY